MKNMFKLSSVSLLLLSAIAISLTGCKKDQYTGYSSLTPSSPTVQIDGVPSAVIVREDTAGVIVNVTVTLSEPQIVEVHIPIKQIAGDAELDADYTLSTQELVFEPYTTGPQTFQVEILDDDVAEADETLKLQIGDESVGNVKITPVTMDVTITNATNLELNMAFHWNKTFTIHYWDFFDGIPKDTTLNTESNFPQFGGYPVMDLDFVVFDSLGAAGGSEVGNTDAQTGAIPERYTFVAPDDEGVYVVSALLYVNAIKALGYGYVSGPQGSIPVTTTFDRKGVLDPVTLVQDEAEAFTTNTEDVDNDGAFSFVDLFKVRVLPNMFIIYKNDGSVFENARKGHSTFNMTKKVSYPKLAKRK
ncbi:MAG: Calx-beta domain-containing protein [Chitinophagales bacterium]